MTSWTVDAPTALEFDDVTELNVRLMAGTVAVLVSDERPSLVVSEMSGRPFVVNHEGGALTISYESLSWEGLLSLLKPRKDNAAVTIMVPTRCPIQLGFEKRQQRARGRSRRLGRTWRRHGTGLQFAYHFFPGFRVLSNSGWNAGQLRRLQNQATRLETIVVASDAILVHNCGWLGLR